MTENILALAARQVVPEPGFIVGPIARVFGYVIDFVFNIVYAIGPAHSLGLTIILMTIIFRLLMAPLSIKAQKSMMKMRELKPELDKINEKYGKSKDPEITRKANAERSALMAKHGANPLSGCLPMLIQMPMFLGLNFIMRQAFLYITRLRDIYYNLSTALLNVPGIIGDGVGRLEILANEFIPSNMHANNQELSNLLFQHGMWYDTTLEQL